LIVFKSTGLRRFIVQERITDMIAVLVNTQEELIKLLTENRELRARVKNNKVDVT